jgi:hypothetical protein
MQRRELIHGFARQVLPKSVLLLLVAVVAVMAEPTAEMVGVLVAG